MEWVLAIACIAFLIFAIYEKFASRKIKQEKEKKFQEINKELELTKERLEKTIEISVKTTKTTEDYKNKLLDSEFNLKSMTQMFENMKSQYDKLLGQKKSSEVKLGQIGEHLAPFLKDWPWDSKNFRFIGQPIDGLQFNDDCVVFVEIKTGKSSLSKPQIQIRNLIKAGKVKWAIFRIDEDACTLREEPQNGEVNV